MPKPWNTKEWKDKRENYLKTVKKCDICGSTQKPFTIDHIENWNYMDFEKALIQALCQKCAYKKDVLNMDLCPLCLEKDIKTWVKPEFEVCFECMNKLKKENLVEQYFSIEHDEAQMDEMSENLSAEDLERYNEMGFFEREEFYKNFKAKQEKEKKQV